MSIFTHSGRFHSCVPVIFALLITLLWLASGCNGDAEKIDF